MVGHATFLGVVILANFKILTFSNSFSPALLIFSLGSTGLAVGTWLFVSSFDYGALEHTSAILFTPQFFVFLLGVCGLALFDWGATKVYTKLFFEEYTPPSTREAIMGASDLESKDTQDSDLSGISLERSYTRNFAEKLGYK